MARMLPTAKKLIAALGTKNIRLTLNTKQFVGREGDTHDMYSINRAVWDEDRQKYMHYELYHAVSPVRIVLFLRDMWYEANGWDLPTDQEVWNKIRKEIKETKNG